MTKRTQMALTLALPIGLLWVGSATANLTLPYEGQVWQPGEAFRIDNTYDGTERSYGGYFTSAGAQGRGVYARCNSTVADVNSYGGFFYAGGPKGRGVFGQSNGWQQGIGVKGWASNDGDVQNYGGHFTAAGLRGIGVYGWAENLADDAMNYGGYFQADGGPGIGIYAIGGAKGAAAVLEGDVAITGADSGIVFADGSRQTTAAGPGSVGGCCCPAPAYDSGWVEMRTPKESRILSHGLGGNLDDYTVDLELKRNNIAGTHYLTNANIGTDFYYTMLTTKSVTIVGPEHLGMDFQAWMRVRIWWCPSTPSGSNGPK